MAAKKSTTDKVRRFTFTLHHRNDYQLYHWAEQLPKGQIAQHLKVALLEYIERHGGQTIAAPPPPPVHLTVPAAPRPAMEPQVTQEPAPVPQGAPSTDQSPPARHPAPEPPVAQPVPAAPPASAPESSEEPGDPNRVLTPDELDAMRRLQNSLG